MEAIVSPRVSKTIVLMLLGTMVYPGSALPTTSRPDVESLITTIFNASEGSPLQPSSPTYLPSTGEPPKQQQQQQQQEIPEKTPSQDPETPPADTLPASGSSPSSSPSSSQESLDLTPVGFLERYDQRQNGTENYRIKVDGLVFIFAPSDSLLEGATSLVPDFSSILKKLKLKSKPTEEDDSDDEPERKPGLRISSLVPFLNRIGRTRNQNGN